MAENKNKGMIIIIVALLVLLSGLSVFMVITMLNMRGADAVEEPVQREIGVVEFYRTSVHDLTAGPRTTNLLRGPDGGARNIRIGISILVYRGDENDRADTERYTELTAQLTRMEAVILDILISYARDLTHREAIRADATAIAKEVLTQRLQDFFQTNLILDVLINEFAVL